MFVMFMLFFKEIGAFITCIKLINLFSVSPKLFDFLLERSWISLF